MAEFINGKLTRRGLLKAGTAMTALPFLGIAAPSVLAQGLYPVPNCLPIQELDYDRLHSGRMSAVKNDRGNQSITIVVEGD